MVLSDRFRRGYTRGLGSERTRGEEDACVYVPRAAARTRPAGPPPTMTRSWCSIGVGEDEDEDEDEAYDR